jgi:uncharacterized protein YfbU (UPF0304 family)
MDNTKLKNMLLEVANEATFAANSNEFASEVYTWDAYEACVNILQAFKTYGYDLDEMQEQLN